MSLLTISVIQSELHWEEKTANLEMLEKKILSIKEKPAIVVLPEMFSTGFSMKPDILAESMEGETINWMKRIAAEKKCIITGSLIISEADPSEPGSSLYYNRLVWMLPNGQYGKYDKRHRFAYAGEDEHYSPGNKRFIASVNGWKLHPLICYDLRFPVWSRQQINSENSSNLEYDALIYVANWPDKRIHAWKTLLQARAIENQCYVIGVNRVGKDGNGITYTGETMIVDPLGEVLYTRKDEEDIHTISLDKKHLLEIREKFPFWKDADQFRILDSINNNDD